MNPLLLIVLLSLVGCTHNDPRDQFIQSLDSVSDRTQWAPPLALPTADQEWLFYNTPHGTYTNLGDGWIADPKGRVSFPY